MKSTVLDSASAKLLGRTYEADGVLWCALSGSGAEFTFTGKKLELTLAGDEVAESGDANNYCRVGLYLNGERVNDIMLDEREKTVALIDSPETVTAAVTVLKLSETAMSCVGVMPAVTDDDATLSPTERKTRAIEFIGDSITCGYGTDDEDLTHNFRTATEDVTKAYAYKTARLLDAEHSMFSVSGWGIISGFTDNGEKHPDQLIPPYYEKLGFSYGSFRSAKPQELDWDFSRYVPDVIVINLGTNDDSYCGTDPARKQDYVENYIRFIKTVRSHNPDAHIFLTLGIMYVQLWPQVEEVLAGYEQETGDKNISLFHFKTQDEATDGLAADYHPTPSTHTKAAAALSEEIKRVMGW